jgi:hypothetical protein
LVWTKFEQKCHWASTLIPAKQDLSGVAEWDRGRDTLEAS